MYSSHTCSILQFCPPDGMNTSETVYELPNQDALNSCDFSEAKAVGVMNGPGTEEANGCYEHVFEEDHELTEYFFSSQEGCTQGQKLAVKIADFSMTADQCAQIGHTTPRIRSCDCRLQEKESTLGEPCRSAFSDSCQAAVIETDECCAAGTCLSIFEDYTHPEGKTKEDDRQAACDDDMPGLCYNEDGAGTDTNKEGSTNCCSNTCVGCGIQDNPLAQWKECTALNASDSSASCGFLSRYDRDPFLCDFKKCAEDDHWHPSGEAYKKAFGISTSDGSSSTTDPTTTSENNDLVDIASSADGGSSADDSSDNESVVDENSSTLKRKFDIEMIGVFVVVAVALAL